MTITVEQVGPEGAWRVYRDGIAVAANMAHETASILAAALEPKDSAKSRFLAVCAEWADLLIGDSFRQKASGGLIMIKTPDEMIPKVAYGEPGKEEVMDLPESQRKVWRAAWQLLQDAWDAAPEPEAK